MPDAAACAHPFYALRVDDAFRSGSLLVGDLPLENDRDRGDARMRMKADVRHVLRVEVEVVEEHERLDQLAHVGGADEPRDGPLRMPPRAVSDAAAACVRRPLRGRSLRPGT